MTSGLRFPALCALLFLACTGGASAFETCNSGCQNCHGAYTGELASGRIRIITEDAVTGAELYRRTLP